MIRITMPHQGVFPFSDKQQRPEATKSPGVRRATDHLFGDHRFDDHRVELIPAVWIERRLNRTMVSEEVYR